MKTVFAAEMLHKYY